MATKILEAGAAILSHDISGIVGSIGETRTEVHQEGSIYVHGEMWTARSEKPIKEGRRVKVVGREGLLLAVEPANGDESE
jgi:membrane-bound serine protease (ClpP class)